jgi:hypothetical protein
LGYHRAEVIGQERVSKLLLRFSVPAIVANEGETCYELMLFGVGVSAMKRSLL